MAWDPAASPTARSATVSGAETSYEITGLTEGVEYAVVVVSVNAAGTESEIGTPQFATTQFAQLAVPTNPSGKTSTTVDGRIDLEWTAVTNADRYVVQWKTASQSYDTGRQSTVTTNSFNGIFTAGTAYTFRIKAQNSAGEAGDSDWTADVAVTAINTQPRPPTSLRAVAPTTLSSAGQINLSWVLGTNATGTELQQRVKGTSSWTDIPSVSGTSHTFNGTPGSTYQFRARSTRSHATASDWSPASGFPEAFAYNPTPRTYVRSTWSLAAGTTAGTVVASFTVPSDADSVSIRYRRAGTNAWTTVTGRTGTTWTSPALTQGVGYEFQIQPVKQHQRFPQNFASERTFTPQAARPAAPVLSGRLARGNNMLIWWTRPTGAIGYELERRAEDMRSGERYGGLPYGVWMLWANISPRELRDKGLLMTDGSSATSPYTIFELAGESYTLSWRMRAWTGWDENTNQPAGRSSDWSNIVTFSTR